MFYVTVFSFHLWFRISAIWDVQVGRPTIRVTFSHIDFCRPIINSGENC